MAGETRTAAPKSETTDAHAEAMRAEILRHAHELFQHYGFSKTNVGDIAERMGMSPGNLYRYYRNKADIGCAVVAGFFRMAEAEMETALMLPKGTSEDRLRRMILADFRHLIREMRENPKLVELADLICSDEAGVPILREHLDWREARITAEVARGIASGEFAQGDPGAMARGLANAVKAYQIPTIVAAMLRDTDVEARLGEVLDLVFSGLRARD